MNFPCLQFELAAAQSADGAKGLGYISQLQKGRG
jgi:hypothetical protein